MTSIGAFDLSLQGRHALVCGASSGIGRAAALALASLGAELTLLARRASRLDQVVQECLQAGASGARACCADMNDRTSLTAKVDALLQEHGPIQILVNNTGGPAAGPILEASEQDFLDAFGRHVLASHLLVRLLLPGMRAAGYGRILNVVSLSVREPLPGLGVSNTIRGAMASWAKTLSMELPPGITVNCILPGYIVTERSTSLLETLAERTGRTLNDQRQAWISTIPEQRMGLPEELGALMAFIASPAGAYLRGTCIPVDGGRLRSL